MFRFARPRGQSTLFLIRNHLFSLWRDSQIKLPRTIATTLVFSPSLILAGNLVIVCHLSLLVRVATCATRQSCRPVTPFFSSSLSLSVYLSDDFFCVFRCSASFLEQERKALSHKRQLIRQLQMRKVRATHMHACTRSVYSFSRSCPKTVSRTREVFPTGSTTLLRLQLSRTRDCAHRSRHVGLLLFCFFSFGEKGACPK